MAKKPSPGSFCWTELATTDVKKAKEFYGNVFGWNFDELPSGKSSYTMVKFDKKKPFAGIFSIPKEARKEMKTQWMSYIHVVNLKKALAKAQKHGGKVVKPSAEAGEWGLFAIIEDPTGALIALWEPKSKR